MPRRFAFVISGVSLTLIVVGVVVFVCAAKAADIEKPTKERARKTVCDTV
jgi:hypothetical protein